MGQTRQLFGASVRAVGVQGGILGTARERGVDLAAGDDGREVRHLRPRRAVSVDAKGTKEAKRRHRVKARKAEKPQKHRVRKPKSYEDGPLIPNAPGAAGAFEPSAQPREKKPQLSMAEMIARELADIEGEQ